MIWKYHTILYVDDQQRSSVFYEAVLEQKPRLHVPGMTEFEITPNAILGLMPKADIVELLESGRPDAAAPDGLMRAELYLMVENPEAYYHRALEAGAKAISDLAVRNWGHVAAYCLDPDGYVLAFAAEAKPV